MWRIRAQAALTEYYFEHGRFPDAAALLIDDDAGKYTDSVVVEPGTGQIIIEFDAAEVPGGGQILLEPEVLPDMYINWRCSGSLQDKHLPASCRSTFTQTKIDEEQAHDVQS